MKYDWKTEDKRLKEELKCINVIKINNSTTDNLIFILIISTIIMWVSVDKYGSSTGDYQVEFLLIGGRSFDK